MHYTIHIHRNLTHQSNATLSVLVRCIGCYVHHVSTPQLHSGVQTYYTTSNFFLDVHNSTDVQRYNTTPAWNTVEWEPAHLTHQWVTRMNCGAILVPWHDTHTHTNKRPTPPPIWRQDEHTVRAASTLPTSTAATSMQPVVTAPSRTHPPTPSATVQACGNTWLCPAQPRAAPAAVCHALPIQNTNPQWT